MEFYKTTISPKEEVLLILMLGNIMYGAKKVRSDSDGYMSIKNEHFSMRLSPEQIETLSCLLSKYSIYDDYLCQLTEWLMED